MSREAERRAVVWAFCHFFAIMCSYYMLRAVRDEMAVAFGVENLPWLFSATFCAAVVAVPVFGRAASRFGRATLLPATYLFFLANLVAFIALLGAEATRPLAMPAFFVWLSVFNLMVVSVYWSFMSDRFTAEQGRRLFGVLAAGGSAGALAGPALAALLAPRLGPVGLLPVSAAFLAVAVVAIRRILAIAPEPSRDVAEPVGGRALDGVRRVVRSPLLAGIGAFVAGYTLLSTFLYFQQTAIVADRIADPGERTAFFASVDLAVNSVSIVLQLFVTARLVRWAGVAATLAGVPFVVACGLAALAVAPSLALLVMVQVLHRAGNFTLLRPGKELLFTTLDRPSRYKSKNVLDTVVYRGGDATSAWLVALVHAAGFGLAGAAAAGAAVALGWALTGFLVGRSYDRGAQEYG